MTLAWREVPLGKGARGLVFRPRPGGADQALVFTEDGGVHELEGGAAGGDYTLGPQLASVGYASIGIGCSPVYDSATEAVVFGCAMEAIGKLDASNAVSAVAGSAGSSRFAEGVGVAARFKCITKLGADGQGIAWVADYDRIRRLDTRSGAVTTLEGSDLPRDYWFALAVDLGDASTLLAATPTALCRVRTEGDDEDRVELVAGSWTKECRVNGIGTTARFRCITALLPVPGGRLLIADGADLRCMDAGGAVSTLLRGCFSSGNIRQMALLPSGELGAVAAEGGTFSVVCGDFSPPAQPLTDRLLSLLAFPLADRDAGGSGGNGGGGGAASCGAVTVRVGGRAFPVQRSVLAAGSEYFARLLAPGGGFTESGAAEVALPDADPAAFAHLLSYMYGASMGYLGFAPVVLEEPLERLRPTAALAGRLLMGDAVDALTERLAAAATPATVLSDLAWADAHGMTELAERLRAYAVRKRKSLEESDLEHLAEQSPKQAGKLLKTLADL